MDAERKKIVGKEFWLVGSLQLRRDAEGQFVEYTHDLDPSVRTNAHADGPFCSFSLSHAPRASGVYAIHVGGELKYVGECVDLAGRFSSTGYGQIAPRNCHDDGQSTNCKLNSRVLAAAKEGLLTEVWFHPTSEYKTIETEIIQAVVPPWNGREPGETKSRVPSRSRRSTGGRRPDIGGSPPTAVDFRNAVAGLLDAASRDGVNSLIMEAGELHRAVGGYPSPYPRMPMCCSAMRGFMEDGDRFLYQPPRGDGARLKIEYRFPRSGPGGR